MFLNEDFGIFGLSWARIHFIENPGMAFGMTLGGSYGKIALSLFRIVAVSLLAYYLNMLLKSKASKGLLISFALILAGAIGNIIDSAFYGLIFSESGYNASKIASFLPESGGYASFLHGNVVDMLHFPMFRGHFPDWFPFWANESFEFFRPVFNIADSAITIGVLSIILFQRSFFSSDEQSTTKEGTTNDIENTSVTASPDSFGKVEDVKAND